MATWKDFGCFLSIKAKSADRRPDLVSGKFDNRPGEAMQWPRQIQIWASKKPWWPQAIPLSFLKRPTCYKNGKRQNVPMRNVFHSGTRLGRLASIPSSEFFAMWKRVMLIAGK